MNIDPGNSSGNRGRGGFRLGAGRKRKEELNKKISNNISVLS